MNPLLLCPSCKSKMHAHGIETLGSGELKRRWRCTNEDCRSWRTAYSQDEGATWRWENRLPGRRLELEICE